ncbi:YceI family protein [Luteibaculum oceani]|uniref:YceI family protein n=1 Tax=Luteibaculum oceani TaxID=1294296 RepID=A0A5C6UY30_9FLAO|nr:YceI family protein [Luteibaculum oceani]TXC78312.1 YceI family protein [Luteibaculum oceani]
MKTIKKAILGLAGVALLASCGNGSTETTEQNTEAQDQHASMGTGSHMINTENSTVMWKGVMLGVKEHEGTVPFEYGKLEFTDGKITGGEFVADLTAITPTDENYTEEKPSSMLVGHLESPDFFDVANHPTAKFVITSATENELKGNLTIHGNTHEEVATITNHDTENHTITTTLKFDRQKYGVAFSTGVKDMVISDEIELTVKLAVEADAHTAEAH